MRLTVLHALRALVALLVVTLGLFLGPASWASTLKVNCAKGGNLQAKIASASPGATVLVKGTCRGNFVVSGKGITLEGNPSATLDGMDLGTTIEMKTNNALHLARLTITGGLAQRGAGVDSVGSVTLNKVTVSGNEAAMSGSAAQGGGILTQGSLSAIDSRIVDNRSTAVGAGAFAAGAGVNVETTVTMTDSVVSGNQATASSPSATPTAEGGGIVAGGKVKLTHTKVTGNRVGASGDGGTAMGSAIFFPVSASATLAHSVVSGNISAAASHTSQDALAYGAIVLNSSPLSISGSKLTDNIVSGNGGSSASGTALDSVATANPLMINTSVVGYNSAIASGTAALGGSALYSGSTLELVRSTVSRNSDQATAHSGPASLEGIVRASVSISMSHSTVDRNSLRAVSSGGSATANGAGLSTFGFTAVASTVSRNSASARAKTADLAQSVGGGVEALTRATVRNSTIALNRVAATSAGGTTDIEGGGLYVGNAVASSLVGDTVAGNMVSGTGGQGGGLGGATSATRLKSTIVATNTADTGPNCSGGPTSKGYNLIGKTAGCNFTEKTTDKVNTNPRLEPLANNGGPTQTMLIKTTSPALNAIPSAACPLHVDQRGVHRPQGSRCDIGAFELKPGEA